MDESKKEYLRQAGINVDTALERFMGNSDMYEKFLLRFFQDTNYEQLKKCVQQNDAEGAFGCAHTLKGVIMNLSMDVLTEEIVPMVEVFRKGTCDGAQEYLSEFSARYERLQKSLNEILAG